MQQQGDSGWVDLDSTPASASLTADELRRALSDAGQLWLAHDGLWFQEWERRHGMQAAIEADTAAWARFAKFEARRIMERLGLQPGGGVAALALCLRHRLYSNVCGMALKTRGARELRLRLTECRVQEARARKGLALIPCKSAGLVEFVSFAQTVDPRFTVSCGQCPPDALTEGGYCEWFFTLEE